MNVQLNPNSIRILLLENIHEVAKTRLETEGFQVELLDRALAEDELISTLSDYQAVGIRSKTKMTKKVIDANPHLKAIGCFCIGTNQVALEPANIAGVPVFNAPYSNTRSVAELVIAESVSLSRQLMDRSKWAHEGKWSKTADGSNEVRGKTMGIVGYGHIGSQVSVLAEAMGMKVIYFDIMKKLPLGNAEPRETLDELLVESDFVTLHVPETPETKNMIQASELKKMKKGSYLINASRGTVVDIPALKSVLMEKHLAGAAIDVFPVEPKSNKDTFKSELQGIENVILTPHIGGSTEEAQEAIGHEVAESLTRFFRMGSTSGAVNFPNLELPRIDGAIRILNVHKNVPGVLGQINSRVSDAGVNIKAQHLGTDAKIGFLAIDVESGDAGELADKIKQLETSIKTWVVS
ncbi:MAG: phosphoglycerate dehydrogenase [Bdellovibrionales bacterium]